MEENFDFYELGIKRANDIYSDSLKFAEEIERKYGEVARLEYEVGLSLALTRQMSSSVSNNIDKLKSYPTTIITADKSRNNSYFGYEGISKKYTRDGKYQEPLKNRKD